MNGEIVCLLLWLLRITSSEATHREEFQSTTTTLSYPYIKPPYYAINGILTIAQITRLGRL